MSERFGPYRVVRPLGRGGMGVVYRAEHLETGESVALKTVSVPDAGVLSAIRREIHALRRVDHPGVVRIVAAGVERGLPWYAMELLSGDTLRTHNIRLAGRKTPEELAAATTLLRPRSIPPGPDGEPPEEPPPSLPPPSRLAFTRAAGGELEGTLTRFRGVCEALAFVHGMGLVHRDLKPDNVFLPEGRAPVLVDFGLALTFAGARGRDVLELGEATAGSPGYMAPEQIEGDPVDARADLYALGVMLYESVTGAVPFRGPVRKVLAQHLQLVPPPPSALVAGVPAELDALVLHLLQKRPRDRPGYAVDVAAALARLGAGSATGPEAPARRPRPYLYRPGLSGRAAALSRLEHAIEGVRPSRGGRVFVGGESGVGKTRFVMEAATLATRRGLRVVTGACAAVSAADDPGRAVKAGPLHPFQPLLLAIADHCRAQGPAETAYVLGDRGPVLAAYEPSLARLPTAGAPPAPPVPSARVARARLHRCLAGALAAFAEAQPILLVLDDLQWADEGTLSFLRSLDEAYFAATGVLVLGSYRTAEAGAALRAVIEAPGAARVDLGQLDAAAVAQMVGDMLAMDAPPPALVRFLVARCAGNPFFVAEHLRAAVDEGLLHREDAGAWQLARPSLGAGEEAPDESAFPLPRDVRALVLRRLAALGPGAQALARMAAVLGQEIDADVLSAATHLDDLANLEAVEELRARQILDVAGGRLRFTHDKLRDILYGEIPEDERRGLHAAAGAAIEARYAGTPELPAALPMLVHHFTTSRLADKALDYLEQAGGRALDTGASTEAHAFLRRALDLDDARLAGSGGERGGALDPVRRGRIERRLGRAAFNLGRIEEAEWYLLAALRHLDGEPATERAGTPVPAPAQASTPRTLLSIAAHLGRQARHLAGGQLGLPATAAAPAEGAERLRLTEASLTAERLAEIYYYQHDHLRAFGAALQAANLAERLGPSPELSRGYATLGLAFGSVPLRRLAGVYLARAREAAEAGGDLQARAWVLFLSGIGSFVLGAWEPARSVLRRSLALSREAQDHRQAEISLTLIANAELIVGRPADALALYDEVHEAARQSGHVQAEVWALGGRAECLFALGRAAEVPALYARRRELAGDYRSHPSERISHGVLGQVHLALGELGEARRVAEDTLARIEALPAPGFQFLVGHVAAAEVFLALRERATSAGERAALDDRARRAVRAMRAYARIFPIGIPHALRHEALLDAIAGRAERARRGLARSLAEAERLDMPVEQARAHEELARRAAPGDRDLAAHREAARAILERLGRGQGQASRAGGEPP